MFQPKFTQFDSFRFLRVDYYKFSSFSLVPNRVAPMLFSYDKTDSKSYESGLFVVTAEVRGDDVVK